MRYIKTFSHTVVMDVKFFTSITRDCFCYSFIFNQTVNIFISALRTDILTWRSMEIDLLLELTPSGQSGNCRFPSSVDQVS